MRFGLWVSGLAAMLCACGSGGGGSGNTGPRQHQVALTVSGSGAIQLSTGDTCRDHCTVSIGEGAQVTATATADAGFQLSGWNGSCAGTGACAFTVASDLALGATFLPVPPPPVASFRLTVSPHGSGSVVSTPAGIDCGATCTALFPAGTEISLSPTAAAGSHFNGWGGAVCHGAGPCAFALTSDVTVYVDFGPFVPPPTGSHTLFLGFSGTGSGRVVSRPAALDCRTGCSASFAAGTAIVLTAAADAGSIFKGWSGQCSGTADCQVTIGNADATVFATFDTDCAGIAPAALGTAVTATIPAGAGGTCDAAFSDQQGNVVAAGVSSGGGQQWTVFASGGAREGSIVGQPRTLVAQDTGFEGLGLDSSGPPNNVLRYWLPDGTVGNTAIVSNDAYRNGIFPSSGGGSLTVSVVCGSGVVNVNLGRFDATGHRVASGSTGGAGCLQEFGGVVDANGSSLVIGLTGSTGALGFGANRMVARWFDASLTPLTAAWFDAGPQQAPTVGVHSLIGGGAAVEAAGIWVASFDSGSSTVKPPPAFLANSYDLKIIRGRRGYALVPDPLSPEHSIIKLFNAAGKSCGAVQVPDSPSAVHVGSDGTVIANGGTGGCSGSWYPHLLQ